MKTLLKEQFESIEAIPIDMILSRNSQEGTNITNEWPSYFPNLKLFACYSTRWSDLWDCGFLDKFTSYCPFIHTFDMRDMILQGPALPDFIPFLAQLKV